MVCLVLINGAPGAGKSTLADLLTQERPIALPINLDVLKHSLGRWQDQPSASGHQARRLCLALVAAHLDARYDVIVGQYLPKTEFIEELDAAARAHRARFCEVILDVDAPTLAARLATRTAAPERPEHAVNNRLLAPPDAERLIESLKPLRNLRPTATWTPAGGTPEETLATLRTAIHF